MIKIVNKTKEGLQCSLHSLFLPACVAFGVASFSQHSLASDLNLCVFDIVGANGETMAVAKDYALAAKQWGVNITPIVYTKLDAAQNDFDHNKCGGLVADNFTSKKYNNFVGTIGAVGAVPNYAIAQKVLLALSNPKLANRMQNARYEVVGYMPYGLAYFITKDRSLNSLSQLNGKRLGVLSTDTSQRRIAQKVGMQPVYMNFDNATTKFRDNEFDLVPAPLIVYKPFEVEKIIGTQGGIINYPLALVTMNFILSKGNYPNDFAQKSRQWFSQRSGQMIKNVMRWDATVPKRVMYDISDIDRSGYDMLLAQLRKEFIENKTYDASMMILINHLRCAQDSQFIDCKK